MTCWAKPPTQSTQRRRWTTRFRCRRQLLDLYYTAKDVSADLIGRLDGYDTNDAELDEIEQRIDLIYKLKRKYGDTVEDIIAFGKAAREELDRIQFSQERPNICSGKTPSVCSGAGQGRGPDPDPPAAFEELNRRISGTLDFLNMPGVRMTLRHARGPLASHGQDSVEFYISTNPGEAPKPLAKIASGGELSRITLAIKNAMADKDAVPTVIYDEIDSGVRARRPAASARYSNRAQKIIRSSASRIQHRLPLWPTAICLSRKMLQTSAPILRSIRWIRRPVDALAHIISGDHVTELSRANAREMLGIAESETRD